MEVLRTGVEAIKINELIQKKVRNFYVAMPSLHKMAKHVKNLGASATGFLTCV